jgi:hypothetical protein
VPTSLHSRKRNTKCSSKSWPNSANSYGLP